MEIHLNIKSKTPIYKQLVETIKHAVKSGSVKEGDALPSMNELAAKEDISRETVKKAYTILTKDGIIVPRQGKGFYIARQDSNSKLSILLIFDKISIYKQELFNSFTSVLGDKAECTILTHNQSLDLLQYYLDNYLDNYDYYVVTPHFPLDEASQKRACKLMSRIPNRKLIMMDRLLPGFPGHFGAIYQDFDNDAYYGLTQGLDKLQKCRLLRVITLPESLYGGHVRKGVERFCSEHSVPVEFISAPPQKISKGEVFLLLNSQLDSGLAALARRIADQHLRIGQDVSIISYNEFELNEVVLGGLTTISADFKLMGRRAAEMILDQNPEKIHCDFRMTRRSTF